MSKKIIFALFFISFKLNSNVDPQTGLKSRIFHNLDKIARTHVERRDNQERIVKYLFGPGGETIVTGEKTVEAIFSKDIAQLRLEQGDLVRNLDQAALSVIARLEAVEIELAIYRSYFKGCDNLYEKYDDYRALQEKKANLEAELQFYL